MRSTVSTPNQAGVAANAGASAIREASTADRASTMVSQFSQAKLPDSTSHSCVTTIPSAAQAATGWG